jgi:hypothetical protein
LKNKIALLFLLLTACSRDVAGERFTRIFEFDLEKNTFKQIQSLLGPATIKRQSEGGELHLSFCYRLSGGDSVVEFSSGEMGGMPDPNDHTLLGFALRRATPEDKACAQAPGNYTSSVVVGGVSLGMDKDRYLALLGPAENSSTNPIRHIFSRYEGSTKSGAIRRFATDVEAQADSNVIPNSIYNVLITIHGAFKDSSLNEFRVWKISST